MMQSDFGDRAKMKVLRRVFGAETTPRPRGQVGTLWRPLVDSLPDGTNPYEYAFELISQDNREARMEYVDIEESAPPGGMDNYIDHSVPATPPKLPRPPGAHQLALEYIASHPFPTTHADLARYYDWPMRRAIGALESLSYRQLIVPLDGGWIAP